MSLGKLPEVYLLVTNAYARSHYCDQVSFRKLVENNGMRDSAIYPLWNQTNHKIHAPSKLSLYFVVALILKTGSHSEFLLRSDLNEKRRKQENIKKNRILRKSLIRRIV